MSGDTLYWLISHYSQCQETPYIVNFTLQSVSGDTLYWFGTIFKWWMAQKGGKAHMAASLYIKHWFQPILASKILPACLESFTKAINHLQKKKCLKKEKTVFKNQFLSTFPPTHNLHTISLFDYQEQSVQSIVETNLFFNSVNWLKKKKSIPLCMCTESKSHSWEYYLWQ